MAVLLHACDHTEGMQKYARAYHLAVSIHLAGTGGAGEVQRQVSHVVVGVGCASARCPQPLPLRVEPFALESHQLWECPSTTCVVLSAGPCSMPCSYALPPSHC